MSASREAFDLFHPACRMHFRHGIKRNWHRLWWWKMVISDTYGRVCSRSSTRAASERK